MSDGTSTGTDGGALRCDATAAVDFMRTFHQGVDWWLTAIHPETGHVFVAMTPDAAKLASYQAKGYNCYFGVNPSTHLARKAAIADITAVGHLHVDLDPDPRKPLAEERARIVGLLTMDKLPGDIPPPTYVVDTGGGYAAYWRLDKPEPVNGDSKTADGMGRYNLHLARVLGGDHCHDISRVMRLPGTVNFPDARKVKRGRVPAPTKVVGCHPTRVYNLVAQFTQAPEGAAAKAQAGGEGRLSPSTAPVYEAELRALGLTDEHMALLRGHDAGRYPSRSEQQFALSQELTRRGLAPEKHMRMLLSPEWPGLSASVTDKGRGADRYARRQIERATAIVEDYDADDKGRVLNTPENRQKAIIRAGVQCRYNQLTHRHEITGWPDWPAEIMPPDIADRHMRAWGNKYAAISAPTSDWREALLVEGDNHRHHPIRDYLDGLVWDGTPRLDKWLVTYAGSPDSPYTRAVSTLLLVAAVRRVRAPGCKFDHMVVLEGIQGAGKSSLIMTLSPQPSWAAEGFSFPDDDRQLVEALTSKWLIEATELAGFGRRDVTRLKDVLSRQVDTTRMAYRHQVVDYPRQCVIVGTTNADTYLRDETGARRYLPVQLGAVVDVPGVARDRDQLWAEAVCVERNYGPVLAIPSELWAVAAQETEARREVDAVEELLAAGLPSEGSIPSLALTQAVSKVIGVGDSSGISVRVGRAMKKLGWRRCRGSDNSYRYHRGNYGIVWQPDVSMDGGKIEYLRP